MNIDAGKGRTERSKVTRVVLGVLWFIPIYIVVQFCVGAVVGAIAGAETSSYGEGYTAGYAASVAFFSKYGMLVFIAEVGLTIWLSVAGILPGTGKWKKT